MEWKYTTPPKDRRILGCFLDHNAAIKQQICKWDYQYETWYEHISIPPICWMEAPEDPIIDNAKEIMLLCLYTNIRTHKKTKFNKRLNYQGEIETTGQRREDYEVVELIGNNRTLGDIFLVKQHKGSQECTILFGEAGYEFNNKNTVTWNF